MNFVPVMLNKDNHIKLPSTRSDECQIQAFKSNIFYEKQGQKWPGVRIYHVIRKEFKMEIIKNDYKQEFLAPFNRLLLDFNISVDHMELGLYHN